MANNYFQFKQFTVYQDACAMKVTTDACLFGAWAAEIVNEIQPDFILDIGSGTGLLSLMLAQQTNALIDAVEIDTNAGKQTNENFKSSIWKKRLNTHCLAIQNFEKDKQFDFIITNPPFFNNDLKSEDDKRNLALHSTMLDLDVLLTYLDKLLAANGQFAILLPFHRMEYFIQLAHQFSLLRQTLVKQTTKHPYFRAMLLFSRKAIHPLVFNEIAIKDETGYYTNSFQQLLKPYYLQL
jgi:tRNA1Val (adenine37-N6)-methyltransferase